MVCVERVLGVEVMARGEVWAVLNKERGRFDHDMYVNVFCKSHCLHSPPKSC